MEDKALKNNVRNVYSVTNILTNSRFIYIVKLCWYSEP